MWCDMTHWIQVQLCEFNLLRLANICTGDGHPVILTYNLFVNFIKEKYLF